MVMYCEIKLNKPADDRDVFQPGSIVSGSIRYYMDQEYEFTSITVALKGVGKMYFHDRFTKKYYTNEERCVDIESVSNKPEKDESLPVGQYETPFCFRLPNNIPGSLNYTFETVKFSTRCVIQYYVRIKFDRQSLFNMDKRFKKEISVISGQNARMTTNPLIYGARKTLRQLFSNKISFVNIKATIATSVLRPGESVKIDYEIESNGNTDIRRVEVNLQEVDKYTAIGGEESKTHTEVEGTRFTYGLIKCGETVKFTADIVIPNYCGSIDHSKIIARDYSVLTFVVLPTPNNNISLEIPFQVIPRLPNTFEWSVASTSASEYYEYSDSLPTYWESMDEEKKKWHNKDQVYSFQQLEKRMEES